MMVDAFKFPSYRLRGFENDQEGGNYSSGIRLAINILQACVF